MADPVSLLWIPATLVASAAQTARNAMQRHLTEALGTLGATSVRFIYGFPFGLLLLGIACLIAGKAPPVPDATALAWVAAGAVMQIAATAATLAAMRLKAFALAVAYTKFEPVEVAIFAYFVLGETLSPIGFGAIVAATAGVLAMSGNPWRNGVDLGATAYGLLAGAGYGMAAVCYRAGILELGEPVFYLGATTSLACALGIQAALLGVWFAWRDPDVLKNVFAAWRKSMFAGAMGAFASGGWFVGFSLAPAALVRTLGLAEVLFSLIVGRNFLRQSLTLREVAGVALIVAGVGALLLFG